MNGGSTDRLAGLGEQASWLREAGEEPWSAVLHLSVDGSNEGSNVVRAHHSVGGG